MPRPGHADAEGEYYPYIDFRDADFPWRYSPAHPGADDAMRPWIALVAGGEGTEVGIDAVGRGWVSAAVTQQLPLDRAGRWAHVHERLGPSGWQPEASRLLCPRELPDDADCLAIVVPLFREDGATPSWVAGQSAVDLQVLHAWRFHTNAAGTFTSLARALAPTTNPPGLGATTVEVEFDGRPDSANVFGLLGPLDTLQPDGWSDQARVTQEVIDLLASSTGTPGPPVVGPPRYASRWIRDVESTAWGAQLNHDPRYRAIAALGTQAGIDWQDRITDAAGRRIGSTHLAAAMLRDLTTAVVLSERLTARRPAGDGGAVGADAADRLAFYGPALRKVRNDDGTSALATLAGDRSPLSAGLFAATTLSRVTARGRRAAPGLPAPGGAGALLLLANECRVPSDAPLGPAGSIGGDLGFTSGSVERLVGELGEDEAAAEFGGSPFEVDFTGIGLPEREEETPCEPIRIDEVVDVLDGAFDPRGAMVDAVAGRIRPRPPRFDVPYTIEPDLDLPAWVWLRDRAREWLLPRAGLIPPNRVVALRTNGAFIEAFLLGLSQQAAAELLWRGVPLSPAAVPMRTIWQRVRDPLDPAIEPDITAVQGWNPAMPLDDPARHNAVEDDLLVVVIRSEILRRYPETVIRLLPKNAAGDPDPVSPGVEPIAVGPITPGLWFIVFDVAPESIVDRFLVLEETIDGPRFAPRPGDGPQSNLDRPVFGPTTATEANGAQFASRHWARPVRALIDGERFTDPDGDG